MVRIVRSTLTQQTPPCHQLCPENSACQEAWEPCACWVLSNVSKGMHHPWSHAFRSREGSRRFRRRTQSWRHWKMSHLPARANVIGGRWTSFVQCVLLGFEVACNDEQVWSLVEPRCVCTRLRNNLFRPCCQCLDDPSTPPLGVHTSRCIVISQGDHRPTSSTKSKEARPSQREGGEWGVFASTRLNG